MDRSRLEYVKDLLGFERGHPHYFKDPMIDHLLEIVMLLGGELWVERDQRLIMEHLLATEGKVTPEAIERFEPDEDLAQQLDQARHSLTKRVFGCLYDSEGGTDAKEFFNIIGKDD